MPDFLTAYQFDSAVSWFGNYVEGKLAERDKDFKPIHRIEEFIGDDRDRAKAMGKDIQSVRGGIGRGLRRAT